MNDSNPSAIATLRRVLLERGGSGQLAAKDRVVREYGTMFSADRIERMRPEDFTGFLRYENNQHWWQIHRQQTLLIADMARLRRTISGLLDEELPIAQRYDTALRLKGLGKAVMTPILLVSHPERYGVWNSITEAAMSELGLWPTFPWGATEGEQYRLLNEHLQRIASAVGTDLWTLDSLWWAYLDKPEPAHTSGSHPSRGGASVGLITAQCARCHLAKAAHLVEDGICVDCR